MNSTANLLREVHDYLQAIDRGLGNQDDTSDLAERIRTRIETLESVDRSVEEETQQVISLIFGFDTAIRRIASELQVACYGVDGPRGGHTADAIVESIKKLKAKCEADSINAKRYERLRVLGCALGGSTQLESGIVSCFTNLDDLVDADLAAHPSRGEARSQYRDAVPRTPGSIDKYLKRLMEESTSAEARRQFKALNRAYATLGVKSSLGEEDRYSCFGKAASEAMPWLLLHMNIMALRLAEAKSQNEILRSESDMVFDMLETSIGTHTEYSGLPAIAGELVRRLESGESSAEAPKSKARVSPATPSSGYREYDEEHVAETLCGMITRTVDIPYDEPGKRILGYVVNTEDKELLKPSPLQWLRDLLSLYAREGAKNAKSELDRGTNAPVDEDYLVKRACAHMKMAGMLVPEDRVRHAVRYFANDNDTVRENVALIRTPSYEDRQMQLAHAHVQLLVNELYKVSPAFREVHVMQEEIGGGLKQPCLMSIRPNVGNALGVIACFLSAYSEYRAHPAALEDALVSRTFSWHSYARDLQGYLRDFTLTPDQGIEYEERYIQP